MKKLIGLIILLATINAQALVVKTLPFILEPYIMAPLEASFVYLLAIAGAIDVLESATEPLANYKCGVYTWNQGTKAHSKYDNYYLPERTTETISSYTYLPGINTEYWSFKTTFILVDVNGVATTNITYSVTPPTVREFYNLDIKYTMTAPNFTFDYVGYGKVLAYCYRNGHSAWGRPVRATMGGWVIRPAWRGDYWYPIIMSAYSDSHWLLIGPDGIGIWVPKRVINTLFNPDGTLVTWFYSL